MNILVFNCGSSPQNYKVFSVKGRHGLDIICWGNAHRKYVRLVKKQRLTGIPSFGYNDFMASERVAECEPNSPGEFALRPTAKGDICILLGTNLAEEIASLKARQAMLEGLYGGHSVPLIHLTCQRFSGVENDFSDDHLDALVHEIEELRPAFSPIPVSAVALVPLYVPFERQNVLKWCVRVSDDLRLFADRLRNALKRARIASLYRSWFVPTLVTALKGLPSIEERIDFHNEVAKFPQHLFTGRRLEISRINARNDYDILATFDW